MNSFIFEDQRTECLLEMLKFTELENLENSVKLHAFTVTDISFFNKYYVKANSAV